MKTVFDGFRRSRRGAVALMFALALFPLVGMVGLAIDFSFFAEARAQVQAAADAATAHAVRAATGTYALETSEGIPDATAQADAIAAGNQAGAEWFQSQLGQLPTASLAATGGACASGGNSNPCINTSYQAAPVGFSAKVTYIGTYPPFFDTIFQKPASATWGVDGASGATTAYQYVEVVMLLDTSASMLLGADQPDIVAMEDGSVCISPSAVSGDISGSKTATNLSLISGNKASAYTPNVLGYTSDDPGTAESLNIDQTVPNIANYTPAASYFATPPDLAMNGKCAKGFDGAYEPCAFACHTDSGTGTGSHDLYGLARGETTALGDPVKLRLDVVLSAAENVVSTMIQSEQIPDQFSVGVFQFNYNAGPIVQGVKGDPVPFEATTNLPGALQDLNAIDYTQNATETFLPAAVSAAEDDTNFPYSLDNLVNGTAPLLNPPAGSAASGDLTTDYTGINELPANQNTDADPQKNIFIVTDGMDDAGPAAPAGAVTPRTEGPMTGVTTEAECQQLKNLGFTVYVLYVPYWSLANGFYQTTPETATSFYDTDAGVAASSTEATKIFAEPGGTGAYDGAAPDQKALEACASNLSDYNEADSSGEIATTMQNMLQQALNSAIRVAN